MKRLLALLLLIPNLAFAQITQQQVLNTIASNLPTNNANEISALLLRNTLDVMTSAIFQGVPIQTGTACPPLTGLIPFQFFANTTSVTDTTLNLFDGTACIKFANLNQTTHTMGFVGSSLVTAPTGDSFVDITSAGTKTAVDIYSPFSSMGGTEFDVGRFVLDFEGTNTGTVSQANALGAYAYCNFNSQAASYPSKGNCTSLSGFSIAANTGANAWGIVAFCADNFTSAPYIGGNRSCTHEFDIRIEDTTGTARGTGALLNLVGNGTTSSTLIAADIQNNAATLKWNFGVNCNNNAVLNACINVGTQNAGVSGSQNLAFEYNFTGSAQKAMTMTTPSTGGFVFTTSDAAINNGFDWSAVTFNQCVFKLSQGCIVGTTGTIDLVSGIFGNSPFNSSNPGNTPYYLTTLNAPNGYSTIYNGMQVSMGNPILATSQFGSNAVGIQQAIVGTVNVVSGDTAGNAAFAISGYGLTNSTTTGAVGVGGFAMCGAAGCNEIDGANQVVANAPTLQNGTGFDYTLMIGNQVNINLRQKGGAVNPSGPLYGYYVVGGGNATNNTGNAYAADQLSIITAAKWTNAFASFNGAAVTALNIGTVSGTAGAPPTNSASQPIVFNSYSSSVNNQVTLNSDNAGNLLAASPSGFSLSVSGVSKLDFGTVNGANWTFGNGASVFIPGILLPSANVAATSTTTGAVRITGGVGITGSVYLGNMVATVAAPTVAAAQIGYGSTVVAAGSPCPTGTVGGVSVTGCIVINVAGTTRYIPYF